MVTGLMVVVSNRFLIVFAYLVHFVVADIAVCLFSLSIREVLSPHEKVAHCEGSHRK
jgi:hypothetical protein